MVDEINDDLLKFLERKRLERKAYAETESANKAVKAFEAAFNLIPSAWEDLNWESWRERHPSFPVFMASTKSPMTLISMWSPELSVKTKLWNDFQVMVDEYPDKQQVGLLARTGSRGGYSVMHNYWGLPLVSGYQRLIRPDEKEDSGICLETLPAFVAAISRIWTP